MKAIRVPVLVTIGLLATGCGERERRGAGDADGVRVVNVSVERAGEITVATTFSAIGTTEPSSRANPGTRLMGRVVAAAFEEGDRVSAGDILVRIAAADLTARRARARSALDEVEAELRRLTAEAQRMRNLYREEAVSKSALEVEETALLRAQAARDAAREGVVEVDEELSYAQIESPITGVITRKSVEVGDLATPGVPLFAVERQDPLEVRVKVSVADLRHVRVGQVVTIEIMGAPQRGQQEGELPVYTGKVTALIPSADPKTRTVDVKVELANPAASIGTGLFARVLFPTGERRLLAVPDGAVVREGQLTGVYVVVGGRALLRWLRLGHRHGNRAEVLSGLEPGTAVIVSGLDAVSDGIRVEAIDHAR